MAEPTFAEIARFIKYNPDTGKLYWLDRDLSDFPNNQYQKRSHSIWQSRFANQEAFTATSYGYRVGRFLKKNYHAHRVAWLLMHGNWPEGQIDHINGIRDDNRIENLRDVDRSENMKNKKRNPSNSSGVCGVRWNKRKNKWQAGIQVNRKQIHLGYFTDLNEAGTVRKEAEAFYGFHPNHGRL